MDYYSWIFPHSLPCGELLFKQDGHPMNSSKILTWDIASAVSFFIRISLMKVIRKEKEISIQVISRYNQYY